MEISRVDQMHTCLSSDLRAAMIRIMAGLSPEAAADTAIEGLVRYAMSGDVGTPEQWADVLANAEEVEGKLVLDQAWFADDGNATIETNADCAQDAAEEYVADGDWGNDGGSVDVRVWQNAIDTDGTDCEVNEEWINVDIPQDRETLIEAACRESGIDTDSICGTDDDDHDWTAEGEGGCSENPGVWSTGGTSHSFSRHCRKCGLHRTEYTTGSQKNPGEGDTVAYDASQCGSSDEE